MYFYEGYHFWGMHMIWWFLWILIIMWIFLMPVYRRRRFRSDDPIARLNHRLANKEITEEEYNRRLERINKEVDS